MVDWPARGRAGRLSESKHLTIFKLEWNLLATMRHRSRIDRSIDNRCPRCRRLNETISHVLQCPEPTAVTNRVIAWSKARASITKYSTSPFLLSKMEYGLFRWHEQASDKWPDPVPSDDAANAHTHLVYLAYIEQSSIGWDQAVRGRLSRHWHMANASYCATTLHQHDSTAYEQWSTRLVTSLWQYGIDRWINRNEFLYGKTVEDRLRKKTLEIDSLVQRLHSRDRDRVRPVDKHLFDMSLPHRLAQTLHQKRLWTESVESTYKAWATVQELHVDNTPRPLAPLWERQTGPPRVRHRN